MIEVNRSEYDIIPNDNLSNRSQSTSILRSKSSMRLRYEAEVNVLKKKLGDLESIRITLGLSQRKMCQLLLVDPSAWTRWTKKGEDAPPHVYRALQWYLALNEKYPALDVGFWLNTATRPEVDEHELKSLIHAQNEKFSTQLELLKDEVKLSRKKLQKKQILLVATASAFFGVLNIALVWLWRT